MGVSYPPHISPRDQVLLTAVGKPGQLALEERYFDMSSLARDVAPVESGQHRHRCLQAADHVCYRNPDLSRLAIGEACDAHDAAARLYKKVVARTVLVLAGAEACDRAVHDAGVQLLQDLVS